MPTKKEPRTRRGSQFYLLLGVIRSGNLEPSHAHANQPEAEECLLWRCDECMRINKIGVEDADDVT